MERHQHAAGSSGAPGVLATGRSLALIASRSDCPEERNQVSNSADYKDAFQTIKLERTGSGILQITLHTKRGPWVWDARARPDGRAGVSHQELADAAAQIARDLDNRVVILTGTGDQFSGPPASNANAADRAY